MLTHVTHTTLYVRDQDEALDFYTRALGMERRQDATMDGMRWVTVGPREQPELEIGLLAFGPPLPPEDVEPVRELVAKGSVGALIFATDDCRRDFERVRQSGAEVMQEPIEQRYGVLDCAFRDPSGNMIRLGQALPAAAPS